eukprot:7387646-Prymnesium_polylepis.2
MVPVVARARGDQLLLEQRAHPQDAVSHVLALAVVLRAQRIVREHLLDDERPVDRRQRVHRPDDQLELRRDALRLLGVGAHDRERADTLAVQPKVFGKRLREQHRVPLVDKLADGAGVELGVARRKALIGAVHEDVVAAREDCGRDLAPLVRGRVDAGRVVRARVEQGRSNRPEPPRCPRGNP